MGTIIQELQLQLTSDKNLHFSTTNTNCDVTNTPVYALEFAGGSSFQPFVSKS